MPPETIPAPWVEPIEQFLGHLIWKERKARTIELREYQLGRFAKAHPAGPAAVTQVDVVRYVTRTDWSPATRAVVRATLTTFFAWATGDGELIATDPTIKLPTVPAPKRTPNAPSRQVIREAIKAAEPRVKLMIRLAADAGLSAMEIATARQTDIREHGGDFTIRTQARAGKVGHAPLTPTLAEDLQALGGDYLFPGRFGRPMEPAYITRLISRSLPRGYTSESLRQAYFGSGNVGRLTTWRDASFHDPEESPLLDAAELEDAKTLVAHFRRIKKFMDSDPATAITECKNVVETMATRLLTDFGALPPGHVNMGTLRDGVIKTLELRTSSVENDLDASASLAGLIEATFMGVNKLRNDLGIGHAGSAKAEPIHARLALNASVVLTEYMLVRWREAKARG